MAHKTLVDGSFMARCDCGLVIVYECVTHEKAFFIVITFSSFQYLPSKPFMFLKNITLLTRSLSSYRIYFYATHFQPF